MAKLGDLLGIKEKEIREKGLSLCNKFLHKYKMDNEDLVTLAEQLKENFVEGFKMGELVKKIKEK